MIEAEIDRFIVEGQYSLAVILSQTMLELLVEREVRGLAVGLDTATGSSTRALARARSRRQRRWPRSAGSPGGCTKWWLNALEPLSNQTLM